MKQLFRLPFSRVLVVGWTIKKRFNGCTLKWVVCGIKPFIQIKASYGVDCW